MPPLALAVLGRGLVDPDEPVLHVDDEALSRGRAAFETLRVYGGRPFRLDDHLARLALSAERIALPEPSPAGFRDLAQLAVVASGAAEASLRLYWTPGREGADRPLGLAVVTTISPDIEPLRERGMHVVMLSLGIPYQLRAQAPWILGGVKSTSYAVNMAAAAEARRRGADDAVFLAEDEVVLEGPTTNVWWRSREVLRTPSLEVGILAGVTRAALMELALDAGYRLEEGIYRLRDLAAAEEAFTSSSVREVMPVVTLDGQPLGNGKPGPAAAALQRALRLAATAA
jgi:4-amino-4-deoxychorismate lyase